jgi:hypothetical protein
MNLVRSLTEWRRYRETSLELNRLSAANWKTSASTAPTSRHVARQAARA